MKQIVIIGGGFAGINLAKSMAGKAGFHVMLVDRNNYNFFPPLLYQVATAFLEPSNISYPFRKLFQKMDNISFRTGELLEVIDSKTRSYCQPESCTTTIWCLPPVQKPIILAWKMCVKTRYQ